MGQRLTLDRREYIGALGAVGFHEFQTGGRVVKQIADDDGCARRAAGGPALRNRAGVQMQAGSGVVSGGAGQKINARHAGDGGQGLARKPAL